MIHDTSYTRATDVEILERSICYQGHFKLLRYRLRHRLFHGGWSPVITRELFERGHAAAVLPYDPARDAVVLIEQFRVGALDAVGGPWLLEIVAGVIEAGEDAEAVIRREAVEEANCPLMAVERICEYGVSPGGTSERITLYCGHVDAQNAGGVHGLAEEGEDIRVSVMPFGEALRLMETGRIDSASAIIALQWLALHRADVQRRWLEKT